MFNRLTDIFINRYFYHVLRLVIIITRKTRPRRSGTMEGNLYETPKLMLLALLIPLITNIFSRLGNQGPLIDDKDSRREPASNIGQIHKSPRSKRLIERFELYSSLDEDSKHQESISGEQPCPLIDSLIGPKSSQSRRSIVKPLPDLNAYLIPESQRDLHQVISSLRDSALLTELLLERLIIQRLHLLDYYTMKQVSRKFFTIIDILLEDIIGAGANSCRHSRDFPFYDDIRSSFSSSSRSSGNSMRSSDLSRSSFSAPSSRDSSRASTSSSSASNDGACATLLTSSNENIADRLFLEACSIAQSDIIKSILTTSAKQSAATRFGFKKRHSRENLRSESVDSGYTHFYPGQSSNDKYAKCKRRTISSPSLKMHDETLIDGLFLLTKSTSLSVVSSIIAKLRSKHRLLSEELMADIMKTATPLFFAALCFNFELNEIFGFKVGEDVDNSSLERMIDMVAVAINYGNLELVCYIAGTYPNYWDALVSVKKKEKTSDFYGFSRSTLTSRDVSVKAFLTAAKSGDDVENVYMLMALFKNFSGTRTTCVLCSHHKIDWAIFISAHRIPSNVHEIIAGMTETFLDASLQNINATSIDDSLTIAVFYIFGPFFRSAQSYEDLLQVFQEVLRSIPLLISSAKRMLFRAKLCLYLETNNIPELVRLLQENSTKIYPGLLRDMFFRMYQYSFGVLTVLKNLSNMQLEKAQAVDDDHEFWRALMLKLAAWTCNNEIFCLIEKRFHLKVNSEKMAVI